MLILLGISHRSAPLEIRERLAFAENALPDALARLLQRPELAEGMILSTCNRVEILVRSSAGGEAGLEALRRFLAEQQGADDFELERYGYHHAGNEAVRHLFHVACGLDSMILGEPQILGQVKQAYLLAQRHGATGPVLDRLLQSCLAAAKRVRTETGISRHAVSVGYAAVELARTIFGELTNRRALLIGAGKMSDLVARHLTENGVGAVVVTSRTFNHAVASAERVGGRAVHWEDGLAQLGRVDVVVSATGATRPILSRADVARAMRARRGTPLLLIDIAVPRDIDPAVQKLSNVYLYDIDALQGVIDSNVAERQQEAERARQMLAADVAAFDRWRQTQHLTPLIVALRERLHGVGRQELERFRHRLGPLTTMQQDGLEELTRSLIQKLLHRPILRLRQAVERGDLDRTAELFHELFGLEAEPAEKAETAEPREPLRGLPGGKER
ncbi:MAG TPA: glutamyl-tRNA reductase [Candidatus Polarisedimenticolaceae bacterium]|nr:glutamyl-tRNA reductase [Candidatus Polarisedimenticolaceae bacterium]